MIENNSELQNLNDQIEVIYNDIIACKSELSDLSDDSLLAFIALKMGEAKSNHAEKSRTASLWFQYQDIIAVIRQLITADRIGDWELHLEAIQQALPIFAVTGHFNYTKSANLYLQSIMNLQSTNKNVHDRFKAGKFVVLRTSKYWAGLPRDLVIEQVLMRSLKSTGWLTRGADMSDVTRSIVTESRSTICGNPVLHFLIILRNNPCGTLSTG